MRNNIKKILILNLFLISLGVNFSSCTDEKEPPIPEEKKIPLFFEGYRNGIFIRGTKENTRVNLRALIASYYETHYGYTIVLVFEDGLNVHFEIWDPKFDKNFELVSGGFGLRKNGVTAHNFDKEDYYKVTNATFHIDYSKFDFDLIDITENTYYKGTFNATLINKKDEKEVIRLNDVKVYFFDGNPAFGYDFTDKEYEIYNKEN